MQHLLLATLPSQILLHTISIQFLTDRDVACALGITSHAMMRVLQSGYCVKECIPVWCLLKGIEEGTKEKEEEEEEVKEKEKVDAAKREEEEEKQQQPQQVENPTTTTTTTTTTSSASSACSSSSFNSFNSFIGRVASIYLTRSDTFIINNFSFSLPSSITTIDFRLGLDESDENDDDPDAGVVNLPNDIQWPQGITELRGIYFSNDKPLRDISWPSKLRVLSFIPDNSELKSPPPHTSLIGCSFPNTLREIHDVYVSEDEKLNEWTLPETLEKLSFHPSYNHSIVDLHLPSSLTTLQFGRSYQQSFVGVHLPPRLKELKFSPTESEEGESAYQQSFSGVIFPETLELLDLSMEYNESFDDVKLPDALKAMRINTNTYSKPFSEVKLPKGLLTLQFSNDFSIALDGLVFPPGLTKLEFGDYTSKWNHPLDNLVFPDSLTSIYLDDTFNQPIDRVKWPPKLKELMLIGDQFSQSLRDVILPDTIERFSPGISSIHDMAKLPASLQLLLRSTGVGREGCPPLPDSLTSLQLFYDFDEPLSNIIFPPYLQTFDCLSSKRAMVLKQGMLPKSCTTVILQGSSQLPEEKVDSEKEVEDKKDEHQEEEKEEATIAELPQQEEEKPQQNEEEEKEEEEEKKGVDTEAKKEDDDEEEEAEEKADQEEVEEVPERPSWILPFSQLYLSDYIQELTLQFQHPKSMKLPFKDLKMPRDLRQLTIRGLNESIEGIQWSTESPQPMKIRFCWLFNQPLLKGHLPENCTSLQLSSWSVELTELVLPEKLERLEFGSFLEVEDISTLHLPNTLTSLTFNSRVELDDLKLPDSLTVLNLDTSEFDMPSDLPTSLPTSLHTLTCGLGKDMRYLSGSEFRKQRLGLGPCVVCDEKVRKWMICRVCKQTFLCCSKECQNVHSIKIRHFRTCRPLVLTAQQQSVQPYTLKPKLYDWLAYPPCPVCGVSVYSPTEHRRENCTQCRMEYCSYKCLEADRERHEGVEGECVPQIVQLPIHTEASSIHMSPLIMDLLAHTFSFLSRYQWSRVACVNHAWRNATLQPSAFPNQCVRRQFDMNQHEIGKFHRACIRSFEWQRMCILKPHYLNDYSHLRSLEYRKPSQPIATNEVLQQFAECFPLSLTSLTLYEGDLISVGSLTRLIHLQKLTFEICNYRKNHELLRTCSVGLAQLTQLLELDIRMNSGRDDREEQDSAPEEKELKEFEMYERNIVHTITTRLHRLRELAISSDSHSVCHLFLPYSSHSMPHVTKLSMSAHIPTSTSNQDITALTRLGQIFPAVTDLSLSLLISKSILFDSVSLSEKRQLVFDSLISSVNSFGSQLKSLDLYVQRDYYSSNGEQELPEWEDQRPRLSPAEIDRLLSQCPQLESQSFTSSFSREHDLEVIEQLAVLVPQIKFFRVDLSSNESSQYESARVSALLESITTRFPQLTSFEICNAENTIFAPPTSTFLMRRDSIIGSKLRQLCLSDIDIETQLPAILRLLPRLEELDIENSTMTLARFFEYAQYHPLVLTQQTHDRFDTSYIPYVMTMSESHLGCWMEDKNEYASRIVKGSILSSSDTLNTDHHSHYHRGVELSQQPTVDIGLDGPDISHRWMFDRVRLWSWGNLTVEVDLEDESIVSVPLAESFAYYRDQVWTYRHATSIAHSDEFVATRCRLARYARELYPSTPNMFEFPRW